MMNGGTSCNEYQLHRLWLQRSNAGLMLFCDIMLEKRFCMLEHSYACEIKIHS